MANKSVERFRQLTRDMQEDVLADAVEELNAQADELVKVIDSVVPRGPTGHLEHTVRKVAGSKPTVVRVVAGGQLTVRSAISGKPYDYARADEFGTVKMKARPFFFPTYRLMKKKMISSMKRKLAATIKKRSAA